MSNLSQFFSGGTPKRVTVYTSGTGTFTPLVAGSWCRITLVGAGAGGGKSGSPSAYGGAGGPAGLTLPGIWMRVDAAMAYSVGAAGVGATVAGQTGGNGGYTTLASLIATGGVWTSGSYFTGSSGAKAGSVNADGDSYGISGSVVGGSGGSGGSGSAAAAGLAGWRPGFALVAANGNGSAGGSGGSATGGGGGGSSVYGTGGVGGSNGGAPGAASGYGAGGGGGSGTNNGGNGTGGLIIIEEFGAF